MKKLLLICAMILIWSLGLMISETKAQVAYGISIVRYNSSTRIVDGYSGTWLDYYAGIYYDPVVRGDLFRADMNETSLDTGIHEGYASQIPAEVYLYTTNFLEGKTYCTFSQHYIRAYFYYTTYTQWFDPYRFSSFIYTGGDTFPSGYPFSYYYYYSRLYRLGATQICIMIPPLPPTPTPTPATPTPTPATPTPTPPPPTPTPSPTPCDPFSNGSCQPLEATVAVYPSVVRPKGLSGENETAVAKVCIRPARANEDVTLNVALRPEYKDSGGHIAAQHSGSRPLGKLSKTRGKTGEDGCFSATYYPPHIAGVVTIDATVIGRSGSKNVLIGIFDIYHLDEDETFRLIGFKPWHPSPYSHWGRQGTLTGLREIAVDFNNEFFGGAIPPLEQKIAYNDANQE